jgi:serine/threonine protein kinase
LNEIAGKVNDEEKLLEISFQIIKGIRYLHSKNINYGDINPSNILICEDGSVKIADFGLAKLILKTLVTKLQLTELYNLWRQK